MNKQTTAALSLAVVVGVIGASPATACQCGGLPSLEEARLHADAIFEGQVEGRWPRLSRALLGDAAIPAQTYRFRVLRSWKGDVTDSAVVTGHGGDCDFLFRHGRVYLVFGRFDRDDARGLVTSKCTRTKEAAVASNDLALLGDSGPRVDSPKELREGWLPRVVRRTWTAVLIGYAGTENFLRHGFSQEPATRVVSLAVLALLAALLGFPLARFARKHPAKVAVAVLVVLVFSAVTIVGFAYNSLRSTSVLSDYLY